MRRVLIWLLLTPVFLALAVIGVRMARAPLTGPPPADQTAAGTLASTPLPTFVAPQPRESPPDPAA
ncbi:MAG: hypothetical protein JWP35_3830, partial [Caulobacter sp.]|nr:hypothetical protein [Caulobacter sp.]